MGQELSQISDSVGQSLTRVLDEDAGYRKEMVKLLLEYHHKIQCRPVSVDEDINHRVHLSDRECLHYCAERVAMDALNHTHRIGKIFMAHMRKIDRAKYTERDVNQCVYNAARVYVEGE